MDAPSSLTVPWWVPQYKNRGRVEEFLGNGQPFLVEALAVRTMQVLNGNASLDWTYQNCTLATVRSLAPGFRWAYVLTGVYVLLLSLFWLDAPLFFRYDLVHSDSTIRFGNTTLCVCMFLWSLDYAILGLGWLLIARAGAHGESGSSGIGWCCTCFAIPTKGNEGETSKANFIVDAVCVVFFRVSVCTGHSHDAHGFGTRLRRKERLVCRSPSRAYTHALGLFAGRPLQHRQPLGHPGALSPREHPPFVPRTLARALDNYLVYCGRS